MMKRSALPGTPLLLLAAACCSVVLLIALVASVKRAGAVNPPAATVGAAQEQLAADVLTKGTWTGGVIAMKDVPIHISVLPDGRLLYWARDKADVIPDGIPDWDEQDKSKTQLWDPLYSDFGGNPPSNPTLAPPFNFTVENTQTNLFCSGHSFLQDGTLLVAGGHRRHPHSSLPEAEGIGEVDLNLFDYRTSTWSLLRDAANNPIAMPRGRWYPYNLTLANGETIILSGSYLTGTNPQNDAWRLNRTPDILGLDGSLRPGPGDTSAVPEGNILAIYPRIFLAPDGRVFYTGAPGGDFITRFLNLQTNLWQNTNDLLSNHDVGSGVMYAPGKVMMAGGRSGVGPGSNGVELYNTNLPDSTATWVATSAMTHPRAQMSGLTLLPDGKVLAVGGTKCSGTNDVKFNIGGGQNECDSGQVLTPELWNPTNGSWTQMANHQETRVYHSTSILLPDARVLVAGGGLPLAGGETEPGSGLFCYGETNRNDFRCRNNGHKTAEIFEPPYLFEPHGGGARPALRPGIVSAPESMTYGNQFSVEVGNVPPSDIAKVVLIRLPSVTHGFDQDQRRVVLQSQVSGAKTLLVTAPEDGKECPPGPYMMFLIRNNQRETPSPAKIVRVGSLSLSQKHHIFSSLTQSRMTWVDAQVEVKAQPGVSWQAVVSPKEAAKWLDLKTTSGTGTGTIFFFAQENWEAPRSAKIIVKIPGQKFTSHEFTVYQAGEFNDTKNSEHIDKVTAYGVTAGCGNGNFCPNGLVTRSEMTLFLIKGLGVPESRLPAPLTPRYVDVVPGNSLYRYVEGAARRGFDDGACGPVNFCPGASITRAQAATFIIRALGVTNPQPPAQSHFNDVPPSHPAYLFIEELARRGVTGCSPVAFCPNSPLTRDQMALFISQAMGL